MYSKYLDAALLLLLSDVTQSAVRFLKTDAVIYMEENVSVWSSTYSIRLTSVLLKKPSCLYFFMVLYIFCYRKPKNC